MILMGLYLKDYLCFMFDQCFPLSASTMQSNDFQKGFFRAAECEIIRFSVGAIQSFLIPPLYALILGTFSSLQLYFFIS